MKFNYTEVMNFENALRGMRNALESWDKSDSYYEYESPRDSTGKYIIGENDMKLAQKLVLAGTSHSKFMRQIFVSVDITAPLYWWKEMDQYRIGVTTNSCSTMHKLSTTPIKLDCFEIGDYESDFRLIGKYDGLEYNFNDTFITELIDWLEQLRLKHLETKDKKYWKELIRWLPESWLQTRTTTMSYENIRSMYLQRKNHKLTEWSVDFIEWIESLPYSKELIMLEGK